ncbi:hypothetical protein B1A99_24680 [Cohnella sp. CIP 111063]|uniref:hypothetical protein n=1 Tax=unclassified Cohnella TaxID=2636738 RepID=UPI000B8C65A3|nr:MULTISPECIES: hypothetical protein [unclassified Cohnella]OXS54979.1 hypothetical protein B1A99_24680 [Cohnella sp. CIP 111063]PRX65120.1 hypothetical protein B0G52_11871 [Cohnella sp. SGD-V74]
MRNLFKAVEILKKVFVLFILLSFILGCAGPERITFQTNDVEFSDPVVMNLGDGYFQIKTNVNLPENTRREFQIISGNFLEYGDIYVEDSHFTTPKILGLPGEETYSFKLITLGEQEINNSDAIYKVPEFKLNTRIKIDLGKYIPSSSEVYDYMAELYNVITEDGSKFVDSQALDEFALKEASQRFGIPTKEVDRLFRQEALIK